MLVVEFIGCPGVGKSSISNAVMAAVREEGFSAENVHRSELRVNRIYRKLITAAAMISPQNARLKASLTGLESNNADKMSLVWTKDLLNAAYKLNSRRFRNLDYAFFEEGPTQYLTSVAYDRKLAEIEIEPVIEAVNQSIYVHNTLAFYIKADDSEIVSRLLKRGKANDRYVTGNEASMMNRLRIKSENLDFLAERLNYGALYHINNDNLEQAIDEVKNILDTYTRELNS